MLTRAFNIFVHLRVRGSVGHVGHVGHVSCGWFVVGREPSPLALTVTLTLTLAFTLTSDLCAPDLLTPLTHLHPLTPPAPPAPPTLRYELQQHNPQFTAPLNNHECGCKDVAPFELGRGGEV